MVSTTSIILMIFSLVVSIFIPLGFIIFLRRKYEASLLSFFVGMISWVVAVQILEAPIHYYLLVSNGTTSTFFQHPMAYMLYGGLMAGIFEETARLICFKFFLRKQNRIQDGLSYGIGHGGVEAFLLVGVTYINNLVLAFMLNNGSISTLGIPADMVSLVEQQLVETPTFMFGIAGVERIFAMIVHIGLSLLVFQAVKYRKWHLYPIAIVLHACLNFPAALTQMGLLNMVTVEVFIALYAIAFLVYIFKVVKSHQNDLTQVEDEELAKFQQQRY